ncbi:MAG: LLM class flavin-dependent oxidoreductase [Hyphomicrobiales bacterium]|nr:MAG: LLM class flavin-dependent oxidoreductase [Hyphomicrobiales bacterium]
MDFGVMNLFSVPRNDGTDHGIIDEHLEEVQLADQLGFDTVWLAEHHFSHYGVAGSPLLMAAAIAERTERIKIGTAVLVLPFYNPLRLAEEIATLDIISQGRIVIGCGRGYQPNEFAGFGIDPTEARDRYNEVVDVLRLALSQENWSYEGKYHKFNNITTYPRPITPGGPELVHAALNPESFTYLGSKGRRVLTSPTFAPLSRMKRCFNAYREALTESGYDQNEFGFPFMQQCWPGTDDEDMQKAAEAALEWWRILGGVAPQSSEALASERERWERTQRNMDALTVEHLFTHGGAFGSPAKVAEMILDVKRELGITEYIGWFRIPTLDRDVSLRAMERFAKEVIPAVREAEASADTTLDIPATSSVHG